MKVIELTPKNIYSCNVCQNDFESEKILTCFWFCSNSCKFKFAAAICKGIYPNANDKQIDKLAKKIVEVSLNG